MAAEWKNVGLTVRRFYATAERVLEWLNTSADRDGDRFIEYDTRSPKGQRNQGRKDSSVAVAYEDSRGVPTPIATCALQAYLYAAKQQ